MKSFRVYIVDTWYGAISVCSLWCICCLLLYAWLGVYDRMETLLIGLYVVQAVLFFVTLCVGLVNFIRRKCKLAIVQILCLIAAFILFCLASGLICYAITFSTRYANEFRKEQKWKIGVTESELPFSIEFRARDPVYSWYDSRVVFPSGRRSGVLSGLHYGHTYDVFKLDDVAFCLFTTNSSREREFVYRVNTGSETVELCSGSRWASVPDESMRIVKCGDNTLLVDVRTNRVCIKGTCTVDIRKDERRYIGRFSALAR